MVNQVNQHRLKHLEISLHFIRDMTLAETLQVHEIGLHFIRDMTTHIDNVHQRTIFQLATLVDSIYFELLSLANYLL